MNNFTMLTYAVLGTFLLLGNGACTRNPDPGDQITISFSFQDLETEYWVAAHKAITETLRAKGIKVLERNANQDANRQLEQIRDAIAQDVYMASSLFRKTAKALSPLLARQTGQVSPVAYSIAPRRTKAIQP